MIWPLFQSTYEALDKSVKPLSLKTPVGPLPIRPASTFPLPFTVIVPETSINGPLLPIEPINPPLITPSGKFVVQLLMLTYDAVLT